MSGRREIFEPRRNSMVKIEGSAATPTYHDNALHPENISINTNPKANFKSYK